MCFAADAAIEATHKKRKQTNQPDITQRSTQQLSEHCVSVAENCYKQAKTVATHCTDNSASSLLP
jgi:hypothetical protein